MSKNEIAAAMSFCFFSLRKEAYMQNKINEFSPCFSPICLHDAVIEKIIEYDDSITFILWIQDIHSEAAENGQASTRRLAVSLKGCCAADLSCYLVHRYAIFHQAFRVSRGVELASLQRILQNGKTIELIDELYSDNQLYWKLSVKPCRRRRLNDEIELAASGVHVVAYEWERS